MKVRSLVTAAFGLALWVPTLSRAAIIDNSHLTISGNATLGATSLNWLCNQPGDPVCAAPPAGRGDFAVAGSTGSFAQYNGTFGLATSINNAVQPLNQAFSLPNFITFNLNNDITIELTLIPLGTGSVSSTCAGLQHCTPQNNLLITPANPGGLSAFTLDQIGTVTTATFGIRGVAHQSGGATANLAGAYTAQFAGLTPQMVLALMVGGGANSSYSLQLQTAATGVPEPGAIFLTSFGLLSLGMFSRRLVKK